MTFDAILQRNLRENVLFSAMVELTYRCNLDCFFCYNDTRLRGTPLTADQYRRFFEDLRDLGTMTLTLTGGEPLAHPDFFTLGRLGRDLGFVVRIKSNAHALRGRILERLRDEVDPYVVEVSLHGASPATHDRQTRTPGSFVRLVANLREARAAGLRLQLNAPVTRWNEHEVAAMRALADDLGAPIDFDPLITRRDDGDAEPQQIAASPAGIARLLALQREWAEAGRARGPGAAAAGAVDPLPDPPGPQKQCGAGSTSVTVDPYGNVYPCVQWRRRIGNLHEHSIKALWQDTGELADVRRMAGEARGAVDRMGALGVGFCPGTAEVETGNATGVYPLVRILQDLRRPPGPS